MKMKWKKEKQLGGAVGEGSATQKGCLFDKENIVKSSTKKKNEKMKGKRTKSKKQSEKKKKKWKLLGAQNGNKTKHTNALCPPQK